MYKSVRGTHLESFFHVAIGTYLCGVVLWLIDQGFCSTLEHMRSAVGPAGPLLQLHAWWHVFVGIGSYLYILLTVQRFYDQQMISYSRGRGFLFLPCIVLKRSE